MGVRNRFSTVKLPRSELDPHQRVLAGDREENHGSIFSNDAISSTACVSPKEWIDKLCSSLPVPNRFWMELAMLTTAKYFD